MLQHRERAQHQTPIQCDSQGELRGRKVSGKLLIGCLLHVKGFASFGEYQTASPTFPRRTVMSVHHLSSFQTAACMEGKVLSRPLSQRPACCRLKAQSSEETQAKASVRNLLPPKENLSTLGWDQASHALKSWATTVLDFERSTPWLAGPSSILTSSVRFLTIASTTAGFATSRLQASRCGLRTWGLRGLDFIVVLIALMQAYTVPKHLDCLLVEQNPN